MSSSQPRIAIIGAGPSGLTLGVLLHKRGISFTIYDLRSLPTEEEFAQPAGSFDLHEESGLAAIRECGLYDEFLPLTGECSEETRIADKDGNLVFQDEEVDPAGRPEISRHALTKLMLSHVPADSIKWNHKLVSATSTTTTTTTTTNQHEIELDFGSEPGKHSFDLVIGADGAWSKVRNLLTDIKPFYSGLHNITLTIREVSTKFPHLESFIGPGTCMGLYNGNGICSQRGTQGAARIYLFISTEDTQFATTSGFSDKPPSEIQEQLLTDKALFGDWATKPKELISIACAEESQTSPTAEVDIKPLYMLPIGTSWQHKPGATIIGDAAHLMCPWAGEGVNLAMWDALELSRTIAKAIESSSSAATAANFGITLDPLLKECEQAMFARVEQYADETYRNGQVMFAKGDSAAGFVELMKSYGPPPDFEH